MATETKKENGLTVGKPNPEEMLSIFLRRQNGYYHLRLPQRGIDLLRELNEKYDNYWTLGEYAQLLLKDYPNLRMVVDCDYDGYDGPYAMTNVDLLSSLLDVLDEKIKLLPADMMPVHVSCFDEVLVASYNGRTKIMAMQEQEEKIE